MKRQTAITIAAAVSALCAASAASAQSVPRPWYVEGSYGMTEHGMESADLNRAFGFQGSTTSNSFDRKDDGWGLTLGYRFTRNWAIEGSYYDLGKYNYSGTIFLPVPGSMQGALEVTGFSLAGIGTMPFNNGFALYGKLGLAYTEAKLSVASTSPAGPSGGTSDGTNLVLGLGGTYDFTPAWYGRVGWDRYMRVGDDQKTGRGDLDMWTFGVGYRF